MEAYEGTQAVRRAISLLKVFSEVRPAWGLAEIAKAVGLHKATAFRLLTALQSEGLLVRNPDLETYTLGPEIVVLGGLALRSNPLRSAGRAEIKSLAEETGETANLEILSGKDVMIMEEVAGGHLMSGSQTIGTRWPAFATSTGKAILAHLPNQRASAILRGPLPRFTPKTTTNRSILRREFAQIRKHGYAVADEQLELGFIAIGAPVRDHDGEVIAAISIGGPTIRFGDRLPQLTSLVCETADRISVKLGWKE